MLAASLLVGMASCGSSKKMAQTTYSNETTMTGDNVVVTQIKTSGVEMVDDLSADGTRIEKVVYRWYSGTGIANNKQVAITLAQQEATATISRTLNNIVKDEAERGNVVNNGNVQQALTQHWEQISMSILKGCGPFGDAVVEYNPKDGMYTVTAKVGMRADRFAKLLENSQNVSRPQNLTQEEYQEFLDVNKSIMEAARRP